MKRSLVFALLGACIIVVLYLHWQKQKENYVTIEQHDSLEALGTAARRQLKNRPKNITVCGWNVADTIGLATIYMDKGSGNKKSWSWYGRMRGSLLNTVAVTKLAKSLGGGGRVVRIDCPLARKQSNALSEEYLK